METETQTDIHTDTHTHTRADITGENGIRSVDYVSVNTLVVTLYYSYARRYHWGKFGEGYMESCVISYNFISN